VQSPAYGVDLGTPISNFDQLNSSSLITLNHGVSSVKICTDPTSFVLTGL